LKTIFIYSFNVVKCKVVSVLNLLPLNMPPRHECTYVNDGADPRILILNTPLKEVISLQSWPIEHVGTILQYPLNTWLVGHANPSRHFGERKPCTLQRTELTPQSSVTHYSYYIDWTFCAGCQYDVCWKHKFEVSCQLVLQTFW